MSKGNKNKRKGSATAAAPWEALGAAMLATVGNTIGQLIADGAEHVMTRRVATGGGTNGANGPPPVPQPDVAADILRMLQQDGEKTIADFVGATGAGLTPTLKALRVLRDVNLVDFAGDGGLVQLTDAGRLMATALYGEESRNVRDEEESEAYPE